MRTIFEERGALGAYTKRTPRRIESDVMDVQFPTMVTNRVHEHRIVVPQLTLLLLASSVASASPNVLAKASLNSRWTAKVVPAIYCLIAIAVAAQRVELDTPKQFAQGDLETEVGVQVKGVPYANRV